MEKQINTRSRFQRGTGCYKCSDCGKLTRNTGDNGLCGLCQTCYDDSGLENQHSDYGHAGDLADCLPCARNGYSKSRVTIALALSNHAKAEG